MKRNMEKEPHCVLIIRGAMGSTLTVAESVSVQSSIALAALVT